MPYCPPIRPLWRADGGASRFRCPANFDDAVATLQADGGYPWSRPRVGRCLEGHWVWVDGDTGGIGCVYRADSKQLFAAEEFTDMLVSCGADLVSFVFAVYGEEFRCTDLHYVTVDAGQ